MLLSPLVFTGSFIHLSKITITSMGISVKNADIYLDQKTESIFGRVDEVNNDYVILKDVKVLWTGVGSGTVIEVEIDNEPRNYRLKTDEILFSY